MNLTWLFAAEEEPSKTLFYLCGGLLAVWAVVVSAIGIKRPQFPGSAATRGAVMAVSVALIVLAMAAAVLTS